MQVITQLSNINSAHGKVTKRDGKTVGVLVLDTAHGSLDLDLADFDAIYRGFVKCWPTIKPLKEQVILANRAEVAEAKQEERDAAKKAKEDAKAEAAKARLAALAANKGKPAEKVIAAGRKELAKLAKKAGVEDATQAKTKMEEVGQDGKPVLTAKAIKQMKAVITQSAKVDKLVAKSEAK